MYYLINMRDVVLFAFIFGGLIGLLVLITMAFIKRW